ncbi:MULTISPECIES: hypothetical protein [unclassified Solwaraspora]|uniref:hypothetical protein n=1 Tax=unclassified Solwaraspora TaxID=2627926 RepID=UPI00248AE92C|nr:MULTISPECIES: hypothetical protein [unclassified Solwaraspora]WBB98035.1 hypothetical protein O7553_03510 [Solwaraspora sp. WMMA2059]WBC23409.1 hypothetical protein O7543_13840 [Solwaraspora sp. WMMA2080]WJK34509.1 hypothetical protein O7610_28605 [Solwaraspora sp. WMMA2065]
MLSALAATTLALVGVATPAQAMAEPTDTAVAVPGIAPSGSAGTATYLDRAGRMIPMATTTGTAADTALIGCTPESGRDNTWRQKACSSTRELRPYTGSGDRTVARHDCDDTQMTSWRNHVDVDVIGEIDTGEWPHRQNDVACRVY